METVTLRQRMIEWCGNEFINISEESKADEYNRVYVEGRLESIKEMLNFLEETIKEDRKELENGK